MHLLSRSFLAALTSLFVGCAQEVFVCSQEPMPTVLHVGKSTDGVELVKIYNSKKVLIRYEDHLALAATGKPFRNLDGSPIKPIILDSVDLNTGQVTLSGVMTAFAMRSTSDQSVMAVTVVKSNN